MKKNNQYNYYTEMLQRGQQFQDYVGQKLLQQRGIVLLNFSSEFYQFQYGENYQGWEIKNDCNFRYTGNLWIEVAERRTTYGNYVSSGIFRQDNSLFYLIGDYNGIFLMPLKRIRNISHHFEKIENRRKTSWGFLLPLEVAYYEFDYIQFL